MHKRPALAFIGALYTCAVVSLWTFRVCKCKCGTMTVCGDDLRSVLAAMVGALAGCVTFLVLALALVSMGEPTWLALAAILLPSSPALPAAATTDL